MTQPHMWISKENYSRYCTVCGLLKADKDLFELVIPDLALNQTICKDCLADLRDLCHAAVSGEGNG